MKIWFTRSLHAEEGNTARKGKQVQVRLRRVELANRLLEWLKEIPLLAGPGPLLEGSHQHERIVIPFAKIEKTDVYEVWKAWDILKESHRRAGSPGGHFTILSTEPIKVDQLGNIIRV